MSDATEQLSARSGPGVAGLLNVTFGNAPELIIAFFALLDGLQEVVKASLVGSVIGNALLVLGAAMLVGGRQRTRQRFDRTAAQTNAGLLLVTVIAPVSAHAWRRGRAGRGDERAAGRLDRARLAPDRPVPVLRGRVRGRDRRQRGRALRRRHSGREGQDGPGRQHRDRVERTDRAV